MNNFWVVFLGMMAISRVTLADNNEIRAKIGSVFSEPILYESRYYFISTSGVLYESDEKIQKVEKLFEGKKQTLGAASLEDGKIYWGEGLHTDNKSLLHIFDLKNKKIIKEVEIQGHIERAPLISEKLILLPAGPGGIIALDKNDFKIKWQTKNYNNQKLHIDSNLIITSEKICATTVYDLKGVICFDLNTGKVTQFSQLTRNPKSEITLWNNHLVGFATEADMVTPKWDIPSDLYVFDLKNNKMKMTKELRGFNFFAPFIKGDEAFITLSTGDFILLNLQSSKIHFLGEFPEPFINNSFMKKEHYCGIGIMGKSMCFEKTKSGFALSHDKRYMETVIGKVSLFNNTVYAPTRMAYFIE